MYWVLAPAKCVLKSSKGALAPGTVDFEAHGDCIPGSPVSQPATSGAAQYSTTAPTRTATATAAATATGKASSANKPTTTAPARSAFALCNAACDKLAPSSMVAGCHRIWPDRKYASACHAKCAMAREGRSGKKSEYGVEHCTPHNGGRCDGDTRGVRRLGRSSPCQ